MKIKIGVSARHVHLSLEDFKLLFGDNYELTKRNDLSQKGQYACNEVVTILNENKRIENVRILGPLRNKTQVEISKTDAVKLGINPPVRLSGDLDGAEQITLLGPKGTIKRNAAIIAKAHIHTNYEDLIKYNLKENSICKIVIDKEKKGIIDDVIVRVNNDFSFEAHIDTDEANAFLINNNDELEFIVKE